MVLAPAIAEVANVAVLETGVFGASPIGDRDGIFPPGDKTAEAGGFGADDFRQAAVAEDVDMKQVSGARLLEPGNQWLQITGHLLWTLVTDAHQDRHRGRDRFVAADAGHWWVYGGCRGIGKKHDEKDDYGGPEAHGRPRQRGAEEDEEAKATRGGRGGRHAGQHTQT